MRSLLLKIASFFSLLIDIAGDVLLINEYGSKDIDLCCGFGKSIAQTIISLLALSLVFDIPVVIIQILRFKNNDFYKNFIYHDFCKSISIILEGTALLEARFDPPARYILIFLLAANIVSLISNLKDFCAGDYRKHMVKSEPDAINLGITDKTHEDKTVSGGLKCFRTSLAFTLILGSLYSLIIVSILFSDNDDLCVTNEIDCGDFTIDTCSEIQASNIPIVSCEDITSDRCFACSIEDQKFINAFLNSSSEGSDSGDSSMSDDNSNIDDTNGNDVSNTTNSSDSGTNNDDLPDSNDFR
jgi:hypothetical protein